MVWADEKRVRLEWHFLGLKLLLPTALGLAIPQHVIQRGNNRQACFYADDDYRFYRECLGDAARKYRDVNLLKTILPPTDSPRPPR